MRQPFVEDRIIINGIYYPFEAHRQRGDGQSMMAWPHLHKYIEMIYCTHNPITIYINGNETQMNKGDLAIINSDEVHYFSSLAEVGDYSEYIVVKFEPTILYTSMEAVFEAKYVLPFTINSSERQKIFTEDQIKDTDIPALVNEIVCEFSEKKYGFEIAVRTAIGRIFLWVLRYWNDKGIEFDMGSDFSKSTIETMQTVFEYVDKKYKEDISVATVAKECGMSYSYFSRFFKTVMKKNFNDYLNYVRINAAEKLLLTTNMNVTEIAQEVGFSTSSYFIQKFERYKKISPKQYRKLLIRPEEEAGA